MPRTPTHKFLSPFDNERLKQPLSVEAFPPWLLRGFIHGLLTHLCLSARDSEDLTVKWLTRAENRLMRLAQNFIRSQPPNIDLASQHAQLVNGVSAEIQRILREGREHSYFVLNTDSDLILSALTRDPRASREQVYNKLSLALPYSELGRSKQRLEWLQTMIPALLGSLEECSLCLAPECVNRKAVATPSVDTIAEWSESPHTGKLRDKILGHFHGLTAGTVRRLLSKKPTSS